LRDALTPPQKDVSDLLLRLIAAWERGSHTLDFLLDRQLKSSGLEAGQRAQITDRAANWARGRGAAKFLLEQKLRKPPSKLPEAERRLLELAVCRILFEERTPQEIIVSQAVDEIRERAGKSLAGVANAVLRAITRGDFTWPDAEQDPAGFLAASTSHPRWIIERWLSRWGYERTLQQARWDNERPAIWLRGNRLRGDPAWAAGRLREANIEFGQHPDFNGYFRLRGSLYPDAAALVQAGDFSIQDASASLAVRLLYPHPQPGMKILDLCAAPGGKTAMMAELGGNEAVIVAVDKSPPRLEKLKESLQRLGIGGVVTVAGDGRVFDSQQSEFGLFDAVLIDAPCSGMGVLARRADLRWRRQPEEISQLAQLQMELLRAGSRCLRPGGCLIYSTCTIEPDENEQVLQNFIRELDSFTLDDATFNISPHFFVGPGQVLTVSPRDQVDGVFAARLIHRK